MSASSTPSLPTRRAALGFAVAAAALLPGCAVPERGVAVPIGRSRQASVLGVPNERFFIAYGSDALESEFNAAQERQRVALGLPRGAALPGIELLSVSGGGENGAFGAGLLCGWSARGTRPSFSLVTGVSTGALTAPFAFLGPAYDAQLREVYTSLTPDRVISRRPFTAALFDDALTDNAPLFNTISLYMNERMMADIAKGYREGRILLIGSTDLDAQQPVVWNVGAIADSGHPKALETIRRLMLASAAIPGAFPPTMFDVTLDGQPHQEMHVDGGAFAQAFLYPRSLTRERRARLARGEAVLPIDAYVIRNGRLDPEWANVERRTLDIAGRAISTMIAASGVNDVVRMFNTTEQDDVVFNLAFIGADFNEVLPRPFDPGFMRDLFEYGYRQAAAGYEWAHQFPV